MIDHVIAFKAPGLDPEAENALFAKLGELRRWISWRNGRSSTRLVWLYMAGRGAVTGRHVLR